MYFKNISFQKITIICMLAASLLLSAGCSGNPAQPATNPPANSPQPQVSQTPFQPSATPRPLAATVNGREVSLAAYQAELNMLNAAEAESGANHTDAEKREMVLNALIDRALLAAQAEASGFSLDAAALDERVTALEAKIGGTEALTTWMAQYGYDNESFREALRESELAAWQRDQILASIADPQEQVHARQIRTRERSTAEDVLNNLQSGADFATLAKQFDPTTGGDLGWFPRGFLLQPEVEEAAFNLQAGEISEIIESPVGYHIVQVIERENERALAPLAVTVLQQKALNAWLDAQKANSQIEILLA